MDGNSNLHAKFEGASIGQISEVYGGRDEKSWIKGENLAGFFDIG
jgi:hypothetical protein